MSTRTTAKPDPEHIPVEQFPILNHGHYANHAAIAPWPRLTSEAVQRFASENADIGPQGYGRWLQMERQLRRGLAKLINAASADDIALLKNTTEGICTVANGIDWQSGDNLVLPAGEFPSNRLPWLALQQQGVEVREVDIRATDNPEQALLGRMDGRTRLLAVSAVQWNDGLRLNLKALGSACQGSNSLFFVDAIQHLGAMQMDVEGWGIDFLAADGHKWLLSPEGIAVFYSRQSARGKLALRQHGWRMTDNPYQFNRETWPPSATATRFEAGSPNMLGQVAMHASVGLLLQIGMQHVENYIADNSRTLSESLAGLEGFELVRPYDPQRISGIVSFRPPDRDPQRLHRLLKEQHMTCAVRGDAIRLSPHFYQSGEPIQKILTLIELAFT